MTRRKKKQLLRKTQRVSMEESMTWKIEIYDCFEFPQQITVLDECYVEKEVAMKHAAVFSDSTPRSFVKVYLRSNTGLCYQV